MKRADGKRLAPVPVPPLKEGTGNHAEPAGREFPEPAGTDGNRWANMFESFDTFLERVANEPEPSWLIPDLLPDRGKVFIVAEPNAGKTWFALLGCKSATAEARDVFLIEEEGTGRGLGKRFRDLQMVGPLYVAHAKSVLIDDAACRAELVRRMKEGNRPVIVFDPFTSLHSGNENDTEHMNRVRRLLAEVANAHPESLLLVCHHTSKSNERSAIYAARGSSVLAGWFDVQLNLTHLPTKKEDGKVAFRVMLAKSREAHRGLKRDLFINLGTGEVETRDPSEDTAEDVDALILSALKDAPAGLNRSTLPKHIRRRREQVLARVQAMVEAGALEEAKTPEGKLVVRLAAEPSPEEEA